MINAWIQPLVFAILGGAITGFGTVLTMRADLRNLREDHGRRLDNLESHKDNISERYVTRNEFQVVLDSIHRDLNEISESVKAIRSLMLKRTTPTGDS